MSEPPGGDRRDEVGDVSIGREDRGRGRRPAAPFGRRLRSLRVNQKLTLSELSRLSGVSKGYLSQVERSDTSRPSAATLFALADALGASAVDLYEGNESPIPMIEIPQSLREFGEEAELPPTDLEMLAGIHYRGASPETKQDWQFIYESIRRSVGSVRDPADTHSETEYTSS